jgi:hypothetical protein
MYNNGLRYGVRVAACYGVLGGVSTSSCATFSYF